jgi:hypothetical protein
MDNAISFTASSPVTGSTGCAPGPPLPPSEPPDPPPPLPLEPAGVLLVERGDGVAPSGDDDGADGPDGCVCAGDDVLALGPAFAPRCDAEGESECDASRIATLSKATVNVTRRLNRITSTRNALVCTV